MPKAKRMQAAEGAILTGNPQGSSISSFLCHWHKKVGAAGRSPAIDPPPLAGEVPPTGGGGGDSHGISPKMLDKSPRI